MNEGRREGKGKSASRHYKHEEFKTEKSSNEDERTSTRRIAGDQRIDSYIAPKRSRSRKSQEQIFHHVMSPA